MRPRNYQEQFHEALQRAFAARDPAVRIAYLELACFYRDKLGDKVQMNPSPEVMRKIAAVAWKRSRLGGR